MNSRERNEAVAAKKRRAENRQAIEHQTVELEGVRYVIVRQSLFSRLCEKAGVELPSDREDPLTDGFDMDRDSLAEKLVSRRKAVGISQAELARRAGVRPETLNRIERARSTPDFSTIRKLVVAMNEAERQLAALDSSIPGEAGS